MSRPARKPTLWTLRKVSTRISLTHAAQFNPDRHFSPPVDFLFQESLFYTSFNLRRNVSVRISLIWVDTLRREHNVGFLGERLICK